MNRGCALVLAFALAACATKATRAGPTDVLAGRYSNAAQYEAAPDTLRRPPAPGYPYEWIDRQDALFAKVDAPALGQHVFYLEWRSGAAHGPISRQRIWAFAPNPDGGWDMEFYTFKTPASYVGQAMAPQAFSSLTQADLIGYPDGCTLTFRPDGENAWRGATNPKTCLITAQSGRKMRIDATILISPDHITYQEAGVLENGAYAFKVPGGPSYLFIRMR